MELCYGYRNGIMFCFSKQNSIILHKQYYINIMEFCEHNRIEQNSGMVAVFHYFSKLMEYICMHVCIYLCIKETWMSMYVCILYECMYICMYMYVYRQTYVWNKISLLSGMLTFEIPLFLEFWITFRISMFPEILYV